MAKRQKKDSEELTSLEQLDAKAFESNQVTAATAEPTPAPAPVEPVTAETVPAPVETVPAQAPAETAPAEPAPASVPAETVPVEPAPALAPVEPAPAPEQVSKADFDALKAEVGQMGRKVQLLSAEALKAPQLRRLALEPLETRLAEVEARLAKLTAPGLVKRCGLGIAHGWHRCVDPITGSAAALCDRVKAKLAAAKQARELEKARAAAQDAVLEADRLQQQLAAEEEIARLRREADQLRAAIAKGQVPEAAMEQPQEASPVAAQ